MDVPIATLAAPAGLTISQQHGKQLLKRGTILYFMVAATMLPAFFHSNLFGTVGSVFYACVLMTPILIRPFSKNWRRVVGLVCLVAATLTLPHTFKLALFGIAGVAALYTCVLLAPVLKTKSLRAMVPGAASGVKLAAV